MEQSLGFAHFLHNADGISRFLLALMMIMSLGTWFVILSKAVQALRDKRAAKSFLAQFWSASSLDALATILGSSDQDQAFKRLVKSGYAALALNERSLKAGLSQAGTQDEILTRALKRSMEDDRVQMEFGLSFVATVASSAPFVGLFGTVWGIYHALLAIGISGQGTLDKVAGPVGEALIMTAIGLMVAIPASISYNFFSRVNRNVMAQLDSFAYDVYTFLATGLKKGV